MDGNFGIFSFPNLVGLFNPQAVADQRKYFTGDKRDEKTPVPLDDL